MNGGGSTEDADASEYTCKSKATKDATATVDLSSVVVVTGDDENDEGETSPRRQSQSSSHTRTTASVNDLSSGGDEDDDEVEGENTRQPNTAATIDVIVDSRNQSGGESSRGSCCDSEVDSTTRSSSRCTGQMQMVEWTKSFHSLVEEAPLLQATIISCVGNQAQNGVFSNGATSSFSRGKTGNGDDVDGGRGHGGGGGGDADATTEKCKEKAEENDKQTSQNIQACDWINIQLLEEGRKFVRRNFFAVFLAHFIGIAFLLTVRPIQALLLRTSSLHRKENTLRRYVKMILYLKRFYETPQAIVKKKSAGIPSSSSSGECHNTNADILFIQRLQRNAAKNFKVYVPPPWEDLKLTVEEQEIYHAVQEDTKQLDDKHGICTNTKILPKVLFTVNPDVPMSQYDLVIIQQAFFGLIAQFPRIFGIYDKSDRDGNLKGMQGFIHLWAVLGHVFGIEDRFNLCLARNYDKETNQLIFKQVFLFSFKTLNESALRLWRSMTKGSSRYFFFFRTKAMMLFMSKDVAQLDNCKHLYSVMKPMEKFCYYFCKFLLDWILWIPPFRVGFNYSLRLSIVICQYFLERAKKCESRWDGAPTSICVIEPNQSKESNGIKK